MMGIWTEVVFIWRYYPGNYLEGLRKPQKFSGQFPAGIRTMSQAQELRKITVTVQMCGRMWNGDETLHRLVSYITSRDDHV
jgi:hypothetical protein